MDTFNFSKFSLNQENKVTYVGSNINRQMMYNSLNKRTLTTDRGDIFYFWTNEKGLMFVYKPSYSNESDELMLIPKQQKDSITTTSYNLGESEEESYYLDGKVSGMRIGAYTQLNVTAPEKMVSVHSNGAYKFIFKAYDFNFNLKKFSNSISTKTLEISDKESFEADNFEKKLLYGAYDIKQNEDIINEASQYINNVLYENKNFVDRYVDKYCGGSSYYKAYVYFCIVLVVIFLIFFLSVLGESSSSYYY